MILENNHIDIFTDGSCSWRTRQGGLGVYVKEKLSFFRGFTDVTISEMEILAVITALYLLDKDRKYVLHTDSQFVANGINLYIKNWQEHDFIGIKNKELWKVFLDISKNYNNLIVKWIPREQNKEADKLAHLGYIAENKITIQEYLKKMEI